MAAQSDFYIYSDAAKNYEEVGDVNKVREFIKTVTGFKSISIIERENNLGLANSIIDGVTSIVNRHEKVIVLEDDLVTSKYFLNFMNDSLITYEKDDQVASIHGYFYPIENMDESFFIKGADCWGWGTWKNRWSLFEPNGQKLLNELKERKLVKEANFNNSFSYSNMLRQQIKGDNDSWAVRWYISMFLLGKLTLYPGKSFVQNIGFGLDATHSTSENNNFNVELYEQKHSNQKIKIKECEQSRKKMEDFFFSMKPNFLLRILRKILRTWRLIF